MVRLDELMRIKTLSTLPTENILHKSLEMVSSRGVKPSLRTVQAASRELFRMHRKR